MNALVVVLYLTTWNCGTGDLLSNSRYEIGGPSTGHSYAMEECREAGVLMAHRLSEDYSFDHPDGNISTNVDCQWEKGSV